MEQCKALDAALGLDESLDPIPCSVASLAVQATTLADICANRALSKADMDAGGCRVTHPSHFWAWGKNLTPDVGSDIRQHVA